jgi:hypothetical protein
MAIELDDPTPVDLRAQDLSVGDQIVNPPQLRGEVVELLFLESTRSHRVRVTIQIAGLPADHTTTLGTNDVLRILR